MLLEFELEKIAKFNKGAWLPIFLIGAFFVYFFSVSDFSEENYQTIHASFIGSIFLTMVIMGSFKVLSSVVQASVIYVSYLVINSLRYTYGEDYVFSSGYNIWSALILPNLALAYFIFSKQRYYKYWSLFYIFLFLQTALIEKLQNHSIDADSYYFYKHIGMFNYPALCVAILCIIALLVHYIGKGKRLGATTLFTTIAVFMGIYYSDNLLAFSLFFLGAGLILLISSIDYVLYIRRRDEELDIDNYKEYSRVADSKYPLKYSISLMYIDEYERLKKRFGYRKMLLLKKMFLERIRSVNVDVMIYNYKPDALILAFTNMNATESFEKAENIRRSIAKSIFVFNENNNLQLTVSQCISEKKRSDANSMAVLVRAEESLQKACKFTRNITVKA